MKMTRGPLSRPKMKERLKKQKKYAGADYVAGPLAAMLAAEKRAEYKRVMSGEVTSMEIVMQDAMLVRDRAKPVDKRLVIRRRG